MCNFPNREKAMVTLAWDDLGKPSVWCDPCLVHLVNSLNASEIKTVASCCGHGRQPGSIALKDGRCLIITRDLAEHNKIFKQMLPKRGGKE